jgi:hypothetical protein
MCGRNRQLAAIQQFVLRIITDFYFKNEVIVVCFEVKTDEEITSCTFGSNKTVVSLILVSSFFTK